MTHTAMQKADDSGSLFACSQHVSDEGYDAAPASLVP